MMICPKCGNKNKNNLSYCDKCLTPLLKGNNGSPVTFSQNITVQFVSLIVLAAVMVLTVLFLPMFTLNLGIEIAEFRFLNIKIIYDSIFGEYIEVQSNILYSVLCLAMLLSPVLTLAGLFTKNFQFQNISATANIILTAVLFTVMMIYYHTLPYEASFIPNIGFYVYFVLSVMMLYLTQSVKENVSPVALTGAAVSLVGIVCWLIGYYNKNNLQILSDLADGTFSYLSTNEIIGIWAVIIGGVIALVGFELDLYSESPKTFYYAQSHR